MVARYFPLFVLLTVSLSACASERIRQQEETIRLQQDEITRQRREMKEMIEARQREERKRRDCNRAFRDYFEKAQGDKDPHGAISLYRQGLEICPDDDVAHYEMGKILRDLGRLEEARREFAVALKLNPDFLDARRQLEALK
ncbi:MAG: tetratricopeptide repeat protein [Deltaproteobacteria bacterium]|nr:tetratricopeptide repeat protein [Deltaproteobacteria bacterium]